MVKDFKDIIKNIITKLTQDSNKVSVFYDVVKDRACEMGIGELIVSESINSLEAENFIKIHGTGKLIDICPPESNKKAINN